MKLLITFVALTIGLPLEAQSPDEIRRMRFDNTDRLITVLGTDRIVYFGDERIRARVTSKNPTAQTLECASPFNPSDGKFTLVYQPADWA